MLGIGILFFFITCKRYREFVLVVAYFALTDAVVFVETPYQVGKALFFVHLVHHLDDVAVCGLLFVEQGKLFGDGRN